jgi:peptidoglycan hydrolase-like protein with peptidoglycan-binding domain
MRSRNTFVLTFMAGVLALASAGWAVGSRLRSPADEAALREPPKPSLVTAPVEHTELVSTVAVSGTLEYGSPRAVTPAGSVGGEDQTQRVTRAPRPGTLKEGTVLMEINGRPVIALTGRVPMHRTIRPGAKGADVEQVQRTLRRLGYNLPTTSVFDPATSTAVTRFYAEKGYEAQQPTLEDRQRLGALRKAVRDGKEAVVTAEEAVDRAPPRKPQRIRVANAKADLEEATALLAEFTRTYGTTIPPGELVFLPELPARLNEVRVKAGDQVDGPVATMTSSSLVVRGMVESAEAGLLRAGMKAVIETVAGTTHPATLTALGAKAEAVGGEAPEDEEATATEPVLITPKSMTRLRSMTGEAVTARVTVGATEEKVLVVPVAAVITAADGRPRVQVEVTPDRTKEVKVRTGLTANGKVQVTGDLKEGERVVIGDA